ncbi:hypothetical protein [uncultured Clostridium sp.]|uniref:hypothetical protein n=1 Tax=uncultured Clostridium sp. TaxID=59620 RepID=UPI0028EB3CF8|nr:hypothetical protein [uncultured Clostridium sp.]
MFEIEDLLCENFSAYPEEVREYLERFSNNLKEALKEELVNHIAEDMLVNIDNSKEDFIMKLSVILNNGHKGYNNMSTKSLLDLYLEIKKQEDFANLLEKASRDF